MNPIAIITGGSSGLGKFIAQQLREQYIVYNWDRATGLDVTNVDVTNVRDIQGRICAIQNYQGRNNIQLLVNCAGVNEINYIPNTEEADWDKVMGVNAKAIFLCTRELLRAGELRGGTILNIVSNASHLPMTASIAYNASKGAAAIMTKTMARELMVTHGITVFAVSPNRLRGTAMSEYISERVREVRGWTEQEAKERQLALLPAGEETDPREVAEFIGYLLSSKEHHKYLAGCDIPYGV